jgi:RNA polymerase sigma-70 factor, ECF subfamily
MEVAIQQDAHPTKADFHEAIASRADRWYGACLRITRSRDMAEDAVQDALLNAWNKRHQFESSSRLETWIHRIAINAALQIVRKNRPERFEQLEFEVPDESGSPDNVHAELQLESSLSESLQKLTEIERVCFVLKHLEQWRIKEIAAELNSSEGTIKQAIFRAVKKLRVSMADLRS